MPDRYKLEKSVIARGAGAIIGMVHCLPLPGTAGYAGNMPGIITQAVADAVTLEQAGVDAVIVENMGDSPFAEFLDTEQICALTAVAVHVCQAVKIPVGIDAAFNDYKSSLSIALIVGGGFVRIPVFSDTVVFSDGIVSPCARACMQYRKQLGAEHVKILADIQVKHASMLVSSVTLEQSARTAAECGADAILVTGSRTGEETPLEMIKRVKAVISLPVFAASGVSADNICGQLGIVDGVIVGSGLKEKGDLLNPISLTLAANLVLKGREGQR